MDRLSRADYVRVGLELLAESGVGGVTIATVCARLGSTKGSFYHHFPSIAALRAAMLAAWEEQFGHQRPTAMAALPPRDRLVAMADAALDRPHDVEAAIRAWSRSDHEVAALQRRLDDQRVMFAADTLVALGVPRPRATVLGEMGLSMLVGYQTRGTPVDRKALRAASAEWRQVLQAAVDDAAATANRRRTGRGPAA